MPRNEIPDITSINFIPKSLHQENKGLVGFVSLCYDGSFILTGMSVYTRLRAKDGEARYRVVYPVDKHNKKEMYYPTNDEVRRAIDHTVSSYIDNVLEKSL